jgi:hypothetical protein
MAEPQWSCCQCDREVLDGDTCPDCAHTRCSECQPPPPPIVTPIRDQLHRQYERSHCTSHITPASFKILHGHSHRHLAISYDAQAPQSWTRQPSMQGYWKCCQCQGAVYIPTNSYQCPEDGHTKCEYFCVVY